MNSFEIALQSKQLPTKIEDLVPLSFIGTEAVKFYRSKIKLFETLGMSEEQRTKTLKDGQEAGILLLDIEARIGEISKTEKQAYVGINKYNKKDADVIKQGFLKKHEKMGLSFQQLEISKKIHNNPKQVQATIKEALANDDIPTKTAVLNKIKFEKEKERRIKAEGKKSESKMIMKLDEQIYLQTLEKIIGILPQTPPKNWSEEFLGLAKGYAKIIIKRLEAFNGQK